MPDTSHPTRFDTATFFSQSLKDRDQDVFAAIAKEQILTFNSVLEEGKVGL